MKTSIGDIDYTAISMLLETVNEQPFKPNHTDEAEFIYSVLKPQRDLFLLLIGGYADEHDPRRLFDLAFLEYVADLRLNNINMVTYRGFLDSKKTKPDIKTVDLDKAEKNISVLWEF